MEGREERGESAVKCLIGEGEDSRADGEGLDVHIRESETLTHHHLLLSLQPSDVVR